jgi:hypothetical protein
MLADVPTIPGFVGLFDLLEAATPGKRSKGAAVWKHAQDAGKPLPVATLAVLPGRPKKTRVVEVGRVLDALENCITGGDFEKLLEEDRKTSLLELVVRAGADRERARHHLAEAEARILDRSRAQISMRAELATLLGRDAASLKLRCAHVDGSWIFSRYDAIALMLQPEQQDQARMIWERMQEAHPELKSSASSSTVTSGADRRIFQFAGEGQKLTPVASLQDIVEMILLVPWAFLHVLPSMQGLPCLRDRQCLACLTRLTRRTWRRELG